MKVVFSWWIFSLVCFSFSRLLLFSVATEADIKKATLNSNGESTVKQVGVVTDGATQLPIKQASSAEIHSSFTDEFKTGNHQLTIEESVLTHIHVAADLSETVEEIVLTLAGSALGSEPHNDSEEGYVVRAEPRVAGIPILDEVPVETTTESNITGGESFQHPQPTPEDIPSFSEWSQQQLAERRRADFNVTEKVRVSRVRNKNYASPDCGAKIVAANPEAISASSVLSTSRDEYMLNHCTARIWFIVELCEAVQAKQLNLANFELFSSSPKEFSVSLTSRFPSRDWRSVGKFEARDSRDIQTFDLDPHLFGKFLKVEVHSHYGKEHYCPLSWVQVYGTSEYEVLATEDDRHADDDDDVDEEEAGDTPKNLFSSATDAVLSIVKKATAPFLKSGERTEQVPEAASNCVTPRYLTVCDNCSQHVYDNLFYLLSCRSQELFQLVTTSFVRRTLINTDTCARFGLDFASLREGAPFPLAKPPERENYLTALLKEQYVAALCNILAVLENRVMVNTSEVNPWNLTEDAVVPPSASLLPPSSTCLASDYSTVAPGNLPQDAPLIRPTKTLKEEDIKYLPKPVENLGKIEVTPSSPRDETKPTVIVSNVRPTDSDAKDPEPREHALKATEKKDEDDAGRGKKEVDLPAKEADASLDAIIQDLRELDQVVNERPASATPPPGPPKDSIFLRLANRIKNLELNMSLSSSYLEELSRRYRVQVETLGQTVNATSRRLEEQIKMEELKSKRKDEEIVKLRLEVADLTKNLLLLMHDRNSWLPTTNHLFWFIVEIFILWYVVNRWGRAEPNVPVRQITVRQPKKPRRRNSVEGVEGHVSPHRPLERRPSDEALEITLSTNYTSIERKRKKKRKEGSRKTSAIAAKRKKSNGSNSSGEKSREATPIFNEASPSPEPEFTFTFAPMNTDTEIVTSNRFAAFSSPMRPEDSAGPPTIRSTPTKLIRRFSSPAFMRTAMSARSERTPEGPPLEEVEHKPKKESGFKKYMRKLF